VGNLIVGGTGKTPHIEYLIRLLADQYQTATLSRGYGRATKGFLLATEQAVPHASFPQTTQPTAKLIGDEPMQFFSKYAAKIAVAVCEKRVLGVKNLLKIFPALQVVLLDDAFQHRSITGSLQIVLTDYQRLFYNDFVLPAGLLRERRIGAKRADIVIVTKCPKDLSVENQEAIATKLHPYLKQPTNIYFTTIKYQFWLPLLADSTFNLPQKANIILLTGIAQADQLVEELQANPDYEVLEHLRFKDHHTYNTQDIQYLKKTYTKHENVPNLVILTTEKDMVRLKEADLMPLLKNLPIYYLPITIDFLDKKTVFDNQIKAHIQEFYGKIKQY
jgi:tetraacyldisaccharide 4'-kinase